MICKLYGWPQTFRTALEADRPWRLGGGHGPLASRHPGSSAADADIRLAEIGLPHVGELDIARGEREAANGAARRSVAGRAVEVIGEAKAVALEVLRERVAADRALTCPRRIHIDRGIDATDEVEVRKIKFKLAKINRY